MMQQPMVQQLPILQSVQQPTIIQAGVTPNGEPVYMMPSERQHQVVQPMVPIPQPGGGVLQYLGTFPTSALSMLGNYLTPNSVQQPPAQPVQQPITTYVLQADGTLVQIQPQPAFLPQNFIPQPNVMYQNPMQTSYQPQILPVTSVANTAQPQGTHFPQSVHRIYPTPQVHPPSTSNAQQVPERTQFSAQASKLVQQNNILKNVPRAGSSNQTPYDIAYRTERIDNSGQQGYIQPLQVKTPLPFNIPVKESSICDQPSTSQQQLCPSPDLLQRALVESSTFSDAFDDFFCDEPEPESHHSSSEGHVIPSTKDLELENFPTPLQTIVDPSAAPIPPVPEPIIPIPSPCENIVSSSCPDSTGTPTPSIPETQEETKPPVKPPRPSFSYRDYAAKEKLAKSALQDSNVTGNEAEKPSYKVVVQRTNEKQNYEVSAADSSTGDKAVPEVAKCDAKVKQEEKVKSPAESRTKSFQVKAKLVVPAGTSAKMFTDADKKLVAPIVENFARRLASVPLFDTSKLEKGPVQPPPKGPHLVYEVTSADGFFCRSHDINEVWRQVLCAVQEARKAHNMPPIPIAEKNKENGMQMTGISHNALQYLAEQLPGAKKCNDHIFKYHQPEREESFVESKYGCARAQPYWTRNPHDMFGWLTSQHRPKPSAPPQCLVEEAQATITRRITASLGSDLPMSMRYRQLRQTAKDIVGVFRSPIHGRGLFCKRDVEPGEMVIEYAGEVIRSSVTDVREKLYESKGIGCYMFRIDDDIVVDATMHGNAARFINHSCEPNCFSKIVEIFGKKHIIIFALRKIYRGEELTYNYKFPIEEDKIPCSCQAKKCRRYLN